MSEYRKLQQEAKELGLKATGKTEQLRRAIAKAKASSGSSTRKKSKRTTTTKSTAKAKPIKETKKEKLIRGEILQQYEERIKQIETESADLRRQYEKIEEDLKELGEASSQAYYNPEYLVMASGYPTSYDSLEDYNGEHFSDLKHNKYITITKVGKISIGSKARKKMEQWFDSSRIVLNKGIKSLPGLKDEVGIPTTIKYGDGGQVDDETERLYDEIKERVHRNATFAFDVVKVEVKRLTD